MTDAPAILRAAQDALDDAEDTRAQAIQDRDAAIRQARTDGLTAGQIAAILGVDRGAVYKALRREPDAP